jgi:hypothetical protein
LNGAQETELQPNLSFSNGLSTLFSIHTKFVGEF